MILPHQGNIWLGNVQGRAFFYHWQTPHTDLHHVQGLPDNLLGLSPSGFYKMSNKMLIDASHQEETRVVVIRNNCIEEFDFESKHRKQLKGNIYLARITRVEPSLQAAFVEYGGNRHGFLAFSEIHPDYYQIPVADRLALVEATEQAAKQETENSGLSASGRNRKKRKSEAASLDETISEASSPDHVPVDDIDDEEETTEFVGGEDVLEEIPIHRVQWRNYKIQEVIKRRQILLVQIVKEERGNKGASLTTYLSLAGRYSVLMPNTARGGGISRKITNPGDRKRLKEVVRELAVPKGMGVILRTAGANRTKTEIKRDYEYLTRLWENIRTLTLSSIAPALIHEEGSLVKRSIRDLYSKDIDEIVVAGEKGYREAKDFMRMLIPSHAKVVQPYRDKLPIFFHNGIESQLDHMLQPEASLKSGGYLVINQTEALVAIDVNSGKSTKKHSVEETAVQTNLEAAEEIARQLRLRDLAGLIVIDFIDMLEKRNIRTVEKKLKDCLKDDRARIQVGRISHFGLMEMSRQRIRASVLESTTQPCLHCAGSGYIRSESSVALHVVRSIEEYLQHNNNYNITVRTPVRTALYVLNHKRKMLASLEEQFGLTIDIEVDDTVGNQHLTICKGTVVQPLSTDDIQAPEPDKETADEETNTEIEKPARKEPGGKRGKRRLTPENDTKEKPEELKTDKITDSSHNEEDRKRRRRRGRRGGRRSREPDTMRCIHQAEPVGPFARAALAESGQQPESSIFPEAEPVGLSALPGQESKENTNPALLLSDSKAKTEIPVPLTENESEPQKKPARKMRISRKKKTAITKPEADITATEPSVPVITSLAQDTEKPVKTKRTGWWQRKSFF